MQVLKTMFCSFLGIASFGAIAEGATIIKKTASCVDKVKFNQYDKDNNVVFSEPGSEVPYSYTTTIWKNDDVEYHFSEGTNYIQAGKIQSQYFSQTKITRTKVGDKTVERSEISGVSNWPGEVRSGPSNLSERKRVVETTYEDLAPGKRKVVKLVDDGKDKTPGDVEEDFKLSDTVSIKTTILAPTSMILTDGGRLETEYEEQVCEITLVK